MDSGGFIFGWIRVDSSSGGFGWIHLRVDSGGFIFGWIRVVSSFLISSLSFGASWVHTPLGFRVLCPARARLTVVAPAF